MFIPKPFQIRTLPELHKFINEYSFGVIISNSLTATHLPFVLKAEEGNYGVLYTHCAKANPHWNELEGKEVLVIFTGPHGYISPNWYDKGPGVPTWNYTAVHATGKVTILNKTDTLQSVDEVVNKYEPKLLTEQQVLTNEYKHKLLNAIIGFKVEIDKIEGQLKLGQQRTKKDQQGVYNVLKNSNNLENILLANYMDKEQIGVGY